MNDRHSPGYKRTHPPALKRRLARPVPVRSLVAEKNKKARADDRTNRKSAPGADFPVVGIGASAGGLEAIEGFLTGIPEGVNIAFVIIQHLAPDHKSMMGQLLEKYTTMGIAEIRDGMKIEPGRVYLNPPGKDISIVNGVLRLEEPAAPRGTRLPIDHFFRSLAVCMKEKAVCVILSGTGSDGTLGLRAIKEAGGMAMAQAESQARYDSMPRSAIDTGLVDFTLPVEKMAPELFKYVKHPYIGGRAKTVPAEEKFEDDLQKIFSLIRSGTGHDFSHYKRSTTFRRIQRRMAVHQIETFTVYLRYLQENTAEVLTLFKDLLISVTNFFRDPQAFTALYEKFILPLVREKPQGTGVRVWVAGCATGEEAYSIAILFIEASIALKKNLDIQVFATDLDAEAIDHARRGAYTESITADLSEERLRNFFIKKDMAYTVKKQVREKVVFAKQDIIKDAPFSRLDLICCRNVLIYMDAVLQKKLLPLFHYTLKKEGALFLGTSESIGDFADRFSPLDGKWKLFKRKGTVSSPEFTHPAGPVIETAAALRPIPAMGPVAANVRQIAERLMLQNYAPPCVLINEKSDILYFHGKTGRYLKLPEGEPSFNILKMAPEELHYTLSALLRKALSEKGTVVSKGVKIRHDRDLFTIDVVVKKLPVQAGREKLLMVIFESVAEKPGSRKRKKELQASSMDPRVATLEQELQSAREYLQTTVEELETSNEELKSTNEELQSTNEELQSSNEELDTSREELQSSNEELTTVNAEMQGKLDELSNVNSDLNNILASARVGTVFIDNNLNIMRFTPSAKNFFKLIGSDTGRPIADIVHTLKYDGLQADINTVLHDLVNVEKEIETKDGAWVSMRIIPYRSAENVIEGVAVTFFDITAQKKASLAAKKAVDFAESIIETVREPLIMLDEKLRILSANKAFYTGFKQTPAGIGDKVIFEIMEGRWDIPELRKLLENILPEKSSFENFRLEMEFAGSGRTILLLNARQVFHTGTGMNVVLLAMEKYSGRDVI